MIITGPGIYKTRNGELVSITDRNPFRNRWNWNGVFLGGYHTSPDNIWSDDGRFAIDEDHVFDIIDFSNQVEANE